jgi:ring-1,2-phenylacetyl-CoA epoxidase subunit PaaC
MTLQSNAPSLLHDLLWQMADDDFVVALRASEWLGVAPHLEEDVAFSSIAQDEMGHAAAYYGLLADLGAGPRDVLAHLRPAADRRNSVLVERQNGPGSYRELPHFDWAYALARHYLYDTFESLRLDRAVQSSYGPLAEVSRSIRREEHYHLLHHEAWLRAFEVERGADADARRRLQHGFERAFADAGDLAYTAPWQSGWQHTGILPDAASLGAEWLERVTARLVALNLDVPAAALFRNGRIGQHTPELDAILGDASEVLRLEPAAAW